MRNPSILREFSRYVSLNIIGMLGLSFYILVDTFFIAQGIGLVGLSALNIALPMYSFLHGTGLMIGIGGSTRFSISHPKEIFTQSVYFAMLAALFFSCLGLFFAPQLTMLLGGNQETFAHTTAYIRTILSFSPMFLLNNVVICFVRNDGDPSLSTIAMLAESFTNIIFDYLFIFPLQMGMFGAAFATGFSPIVSLCILSTHFMKKENTLRLSKVAPSPRALSDISALGVSSFIAELSSGIVILVFNVLILNITGTIGVAAYGVIVNIALVVVALLTGIAQGIQPLLSRYYGERRTADIRTVLRYGFVSAITISLLIYGISILLSTPIISAFNRDADLTLIQIATDGIRLYFTAFGFIGINILVATYFSSTTRVKLAFLISSLRGFFLIIPVAVLLSTMLELTGVWLAVPVTECIVVLISIIALKKPDNHQSRTLVPSIFNWTFSF